MGFLVFTDLDGTLLDHHNYSWKEARSALAGIDRRNIPLILTTSKTRAELLPLRQELSNNWPFITENGGAIFFPDNSWPHEVADTIQVDEYRVLVIGRQYSFIRTVFTQLQTEYPIRGFGDMTVGDIVSLTSLTPQEAELAKQREFTEPFILEQPDLLEEISRAANQKGCTVVQGGRFHHFMAMNQSKGAAVARIISSYCSHSECTSIGLGDSGNDLSMLDQVDIPVLIAKPDGSFEDYDTAGLIRSRYPGSKGWGECMMDIIDHMPAYL